MYMEIKGSDHRKRKLFYFFFLLFFMEIFAQIFLFLILRMAKIIIENLGYRQKFNGTIAITAIIPFLT